MADMERCKLIPGVDFVAPSECINAKECAYINEALEAAVVCMAFSSGNTTVCDTKNGIKILREDGEQTPVNVEVVCSGKKHRYVLFGEMVCRGAFDVRPYSGAEK